MAQYVKRPWYPFYPVDFNEDESVAGMSDAAELAYRRLLDRTWLSKDCTLPDDERVIARMAKVNAKTWKAIRSRILAVFPVLPQEPGDFSAPRRHNPRLTAEYEKTCGISKARAAAASARKSLQTKENTPANVLQLHTYPHLSTNPMESGDVSHDNQAKQALQGIHRDFLYTDNQDCKSLQSNETAPAIDEQTKSYSSHISHVTEVLKQKDLDLANVSKLIARDMPPVTQGGEAPVEFWDVEVSPEEKYLKGALAFSESVADRQRPWLDFRWRKDCRKLSVAIQESIALLFEEFYGFRADTGPDGWAGDHNRLSAIYRKVWRGHTEKRKETHVTSV